MRTSPGQMLGGPRNGTSVEVPERHMGLPREPGLMVGDLHRILTNGGI